MIPSKTCRATHFASCSGSVAMSPLHGTQAGANERIARGNFHPLPESAAWPAPIGKLHHLLQRDAAPPPARRPGTRRRNGMSAQRLVHCQLEGRADRAPGSAARSEIPRSVRREDCHPDRILPTSAARHWRPPGTNRSSGHGSLTGPKSSEREDRRAFGQHVVDDRHFRIVWSP